MSSTTTLKQPPSSPEPRPYQVAAGEFILRNLFAALFMEQGLGKTRSTLRPVAELLGTGEVERVLVIAPKRVANTVWPAEIDKWPECWHLMWSLVTGTAAQRKKALQMDAQVFVINRENVAWLVEQCGDHWPFDMVIVDESSSFKSAKTKRWKALRKVRGQIRRMVLLSGTPTPNGLLDLWSQVFLLDGGHRLCRTFWAYRNKWFQSDYHGYNWTARPTAEKQILSAVEDLCMTLKAADYLDLPDKIMNTVNVSLPAGDAQEAYETMARQFLLIMEEGDVSATNAAVLVNKLLQIANGCVYDSDRNHHHIHDAKLDALEEIIESACGAPILVAHTFQSDAVRIKQRFKNARVLKTDKDVEDWNAGKAGQLMIAHPASCGHGLNLQHGGHILVWFGLPWSLELYEQMNARLHRMGQTKPVFIHHILAESTIDETVMAALHAKSEGQQALLDAMKKDLQRLFN